MKQIIHKIFNTKADALGLSVFRMCYALVLFFEMMQMFKFRNILYDDIPFVYGGELFGGIILIFNMCILGFLFLGLFTRFSTIVNYLLGIIIFSSTSRFEYHVYYAFVGINFLLMFMPIARVFSLDSLLQKLKYTNIGRPFKVDRKVLVLNYLIPIFMGIGLVYFDSIFRKMDSPMWRGGLGMWLPSSMPMAVWTDTSLVLNQEYVVRFFGYLVIVFETVFIFLFWFKRFRVPFLLLGLFFHFGILITYPIPWFGLGVIGIYLLMVPVRFWVCISSKFKSKSPTYKFYYDAECPLCNKVVVAIRHFDVFNRISCVTVQGYAVEDTALNGISEMDLLINIHGVDNNGKVFVGFDAYIALFKHMIYLYPLAIFASLPGISSIGRRIYKYIAGNRLTERCTSENCMMPEFATPMKETDDFLVKGWNQLNITKQFWKWLFIGTLTLQLIIIGLCPLFSPYTRNTIVGNALAKCYSIYGLAAKKGIGLTTHPVFMDGHFKNYNHIFKIVCNDNNKIVPLLDNKGMVTNSYATGAFWVNYTFRVSAPALFKEQYENGVVRYLRYFEHENHLTGSSYTIYVKHLDAPNKWEKDFLRNQIAKPWQPAGTCKLTPTDATFTWNEMTEAVFKSELGIPQLELR